MWKEQNNQLHQSFEFKDFAQAFTFMMRVAFGAEKMEHHPDWSNSWNKVNITLSTHSLGNIITEKDKKLAEAIDKIRLEFI